MSGPTGLDSVFQRQQLDWIQKNMKRKEGEKQAKQARETHERLKAELMTHMSDNGASVALAQIHSQEFALQQASLDRQMQAATQLELGLERLDTRLEIAKLDFVQNMTAEENRHDLEMKKREFQRLGATDPFDPIPAPDFEIS